MTGILLGVLASLSWASASFVSARPLSEIPVKLFSLIRFSLVGGVFLAVALFSSGFADFGKAELVLLAASGIVGIAFGETLLYKAIKEMGVLKGLIAFSLNIPMTALLAVCLGDRNATFSLFLGAALATAAVIVAAVVRSRVAANEPVSSGRARLRCRPRRRRGPVRGHNPDEGGRRRRQLDLRGVQRSRFVGSPCHCHPGRRFARAALPPGGRPPGRGQGHCLERLPELGPWSLPREHGLAAWRCHDRGQLPVPLTGLRGRHCVSHVPSDAGPAAFRLRRPAVPRAVLPLLLGQDLPSTPGAAGSAFCTSRRPPAIPNWHSRPVSATTCAP